MTVLGSPLRPVLRSPLYSPLVGKWGGAFSPSALFQTGDILLWYDPSDLTTMFANTTGTTQVAADGDSVALMLDKGQWGGKTLQQVLAAQPELAANGGFDSDTVWTKGANVTISGGTANYNDVATNGNIVTQSVAVVSGRSYSVTYTISSITGTLSAKIGSVNGAAYSTAGTRTEIIVANTTGSADIGILGRGAGVSQATIDNISVKVIPGYHRVQATGTSMPKYKTDGTLHWLLYDGTDDSHATGTITWGTDEVAACAGVTKSSDTAYQMILEFGPSVSSNNGSFSVLATSGAGVAATNALAFGLRGTAATSYDATSYPSAASYVLTSILDISEANTEDENRPRVNGATPTLTATGGANAGTGNFGSYPLYFGRRNGASLPFNGREYQTVIRSRLLSAAELSSLETFIAAKTGVIL